MMWDVYVIDPRGQRVTELVEHLGIAWTSRARGVGAWQMSIEVDHPATERLTRPLFGIELEHRVTGQVLSGRWTSRTTRVVEDRTVVELAGPDDVALLDRCITIPAAGYSHVEVTGTLEWCLKEIARVSVGPASPAGLLPKEITRALLNPIPPLTVAPSLDRGPTVTVSTRYQAILELLQAKLGPDQWVITAAGGIFDIHPPVVRPVRLSARDGTVSEVVVTETAPTVTRVLVGGQGEAEDRVIRSVYAAPDVIERWGLITRFRDRRDTADVDVLDRAGLEAIAEGAAQWGITVGILDVPSGPQYSTDWRVGDIVQAEIADDVWLPQQVVEATLTIDATGTVVAPKIGAAPAASLDGLVGALYARIAQLATRIGALERR